MTSRHNELGHNQELNPITRIAFPETNASPNSSWDTCNQSLNSPRTPDEEDACTQKEVVLGVGISGEKWDLNQKLLLEPTVPDDASVRSLLWKTLWDVSVSIPTLGWRRYFQNCFDPSLPPSPHTAKRDWFRFVRPASTTKRALALRPISSGKVRKEGQCGCSSWGCFWCHASHNPTLGQQQGLLVLSQASHQMTAEMAFHSRGCFMLPPMPRFARGRPHCGLVVKPLAPTPPMREPRSLPLLSTPQRLWKLLAETRDSKRRLQTVPPTDVLFPPWRFWLSRKPNPTAETMPSGCCGLEDATCFASKR